MNSDLLLLPRFSFANTHVNSVHFMGSNCRFTRANTIFFPNLNLIHPIQKIQITDESRKEKAERRKNNTRTHRETEYTQSGRTVGEDDLSVGGF